MPLIERLDPSAHDRAGFLCGEPSLDGYLQRLANKHQRTGISTTHILVDAQALAPKPIFGYYTLSAAQLLLSELSPELQSKLPKYPVPAARMGRLAVSTAHQGCGYGDLLVGHAVSRCLALREELGIRILIVDALHDKAAAFYLNYGFRYCNEQANSLYLTL